MHCLILAGGLGTRIGEQARDLPKSLIPVLGESFIVHQLRLLAASGVESVTVSVGYKGGQIVEAIRARDDLGVRIVFSDEGETLRGTGGAVRLAAERSLVPERFFILYGDSYLPISYRDVWQNFDRCGSPALMTVFKNDGQWDKSNVVFEDGKIPIYDKSEAAANQYDFRYIDYGLTLLTRQGVSEYFPDRPKFDLSEPLCFLASRGLLAGFEVKQRFYEIGSPAGLADFARWLGSSCSPVAVEET